jgi:hypothetical protein
MSSAIIDSVVQKPQPPRRQFTKLTETPQYSEVMSQPSKSRVAGNTQRSQPTAPSMKASPRGGTQKYHLAPISPAHTKEVTTTASPRSRQLIPFKPKKNTQPQLLLHQPHRVDPPPFMNAPVRLPTSSSDALGSSSQRQTTMALIKVDHRFVAVCVVDFPEIFCSRLCHFAPLPFHCSHAQQFLHIAFTALLGLCSSGQCM